MTLGNIIKAGLYKATGKAVYKRQLNSRIKVEKQASDSVFKKYEKEMKSI